MAKKQVGLRDIEINETPRRLRLLAPLRYLAIQAPERQFYDFVLPAIVGTGATVLFCFLDPKPKFFGDDGLVVLIQGFLMMAVPFLIGSLAAVALASDSENLDRRLTGVGVILDGAYLTLRQFMTYLLGYLSFFGLSLFIGMTIAIMVEPSISKLISGSETIVWWVQQLASYLFFVLCSAFAITIFWSLYFLTEVVARDI